MDFASDEASHEAAPRLFVQHALGETPVVGPDDLANLVVGMSFADKTDSPIRPVGPVQGARAPTGDIGAVGADGDVIDAGHVDGVFQVPVPGRV